MRCPTCQGRTFESCEYRTPNLRAPALKCASCHAITLVEAAARNREELASVRRAIATRRTCSGTTRARRVDEG